MVRLGESDQVYGLRGSIKFLFDKELKIWRDRVVTNIDESRVKEATFNNANGAFHFVHSDDGWKKTAGPKIKNFDPTHVKDIVSSAANLRALDFATPNLSETEAGLDKPTGTLTLLIGPEPKTNDQDAGQPVTPTANEKLVIRIGKQGQKDTEFLCQEGRRTRDCPDFKIPGRPTAAEQQNVRQNRKQKGQRSSRHHAANAHRLRPNPAGSDETTSRTTKATRPNALATSEMLGLIRHCV